VNIINAGCDSLEGTHTTVTTTHGTETTSEMNHETTQDSSCLIINSDNVRNFMDNSNANLVIQYQGNVCLDRSAFESIQNEVMGIIIRKNNIRTLPANLFVDLGFTYNIYIDLSDNNIETIDFSAFRNVLNVQGINLSNNLLTDLPENAFVNLDVQFIYLSSNNLNSLNADSFYSLHNLQGINIDGNPIVANLQLIQDFKNELSQNSPSVNVYYY
jgi:hypothetical protein